MVLPDRFFLVNFKVYQGTVGDDGVSVAETIERVAESTGTPFVVAPQTPDLRRHARSTSMPVIAQSVDPVEPGRGTGRILPEALAAAGAAGTLVNHAEHPVKHDDMARVIERCRSVGLESIVCVDSLAAGRSVATLDPDWLLFEKPADIATDRTMARAQPGQVRAFLSMIEETNPRTRCLLGGGISTAADVEAAFVLGADGVGASSAVLRAADPAAWLEAVAAAVPGTA